MAGPAVDVVARRVVCGCEYLMVALLVLVVVVKGERRGHEKWGGGRGRT